MVFSKEFYNGLTIIQKYILGVSYYIKLKKHIQDRWSLKFIMIAKKVKKNPCSWRPSKTLIETNLFLSLFNFTKNMYWTFLKFVVLALKNLLKNELLADLRSILKNVIRHLLSSRGFAWPVFLLNDSYYFLLFIL